MIKMTKKNIKNFKKNNKKYGGTSSSEQYRKRINELFANEEFANQSSAHEEFANQSSVHDSSVHDSEQDIIIDVSGTIFRAKKDTLMRYSGYF